MSTQPLGNPKARWLDANGNPLSGGLLYTYAAGTSTPLSTYTTRAGDVANANPVVLDANGEADIWMTPGVDYKFVLKDSAGVTRWTVDNFPSPAEQSATTADASTDPGGRLTLTSGTPVTTSDVTGATTIHYAPYKHSKVPLYDGSTWSLFDIGDGLSQTTGDNTKSPAAVANNSNYDLFVWNDSGTLRLSRGPAWASDTALPSGVGTSERERVNGRLVNKYSITNGPGAQRGLYVGTIRSDGSAQINDSLAKRHVWNMHNRVQRGMRGGPETANGWSYTTASFRQANGNAANQLDMVRGLDEDSVWADVHVTCSHGTVGQTSNPRTAIGLDSTSAAASGCIFLGVTASADYKDVPSSWTGTPGLGRHTLVWLEWGHGGNTCSWIGDSDSTGAAQQSGIHGECWA